MTCHNCQSICRRFGKHRNGLQRFRCQQCRKTFTEDHATPLDSMRLPMDKADQVLRLLVEGTSIRSIERFTGVHRDTILRLMLLAVEKINTKLRHTFENLEIARIQILLRPLTLLLTFAQGLAATHSLGIFRQPQLLLWHQCLTCES